MIMNKHLKQLIEISEIDKQSDALEPKIREIRKSLDDLLHSQQQLQVKISRIEEVKNELQNAIAHHENVILENNSKVEGISQKLKEAKSDRESRSLAIEEDLAKEQIRHANNEIERINKDIESKANEEQEIQDKLKEIQDQIEQNQQTTDAQIDEVRKQQNEISKHKEKAVEQMDQKLIIFYEKIRKWAKNTSVVPIKKQACGGCFIRISDSIYAEITKSDEILTCPHCGRILYLEDA